MYSRFVALGLMALLSLASAHVVEDSELHDIGSSGWSSAEDINELEKRSTATCGPSANNAVCAPNLCCGPNGVCGTGGYYCDAPSCLFQYGAACDANQTPPGVNTTLVPRPKFGSTPYGVSIQDCGIPGKIALTFDDGPYIYTSDLLDLLKAKGVNATFFLVGNNGGKGQINDPKTGYPALIQRMYNEGHQIGSHTWSHQDLSTLTRQQRYDQIVKNEIALTDILGFFPTYLRPPYESCNADCLTDLANLGYHVANYDIDTLDWQGNYTHSQSIFVSSLKSGTSPTGGYISLAHDIHNQTVHGFVSFMIDNLHAAGYSTALYGECMHDSPANWYRSPTTGQPYNNGTSTVKSLSSSASTSVSSSSTATSVVHTTATTSSTPTPTPTAVEGGEGAFGSRTGNATGNVTVSAGSGGAQPKSGAGRKLAETAERLVGFALTCGLLIWTLWL